jgi:hypothetical protein
MIVDESNFYKKMIIITWGKIIFFKNEQKMYLINLQPIQYKRTKWGKKRQKKLVVVKLS